MFETSAKYELGNATEISIATQVAFIIAGCTHVTYYKTLKHVLGIEAVCLPTFQLTIERMYPVVKEMVDKMCDDAKDDMRIGSWSLCLSTSLSFSHFLSLSPSF